MQYCLAFSFCSPARLRHHVRTLTVLIWLCDVIWAQLISGAHSAGASSVNLQADAPFLPYAELFSGEALQLQRPKATPFGVTCDGITQEYCTKPGQFYPRSEISFFIDENRSMMKRMFGTVSSRSLLRKDEEEVAMDNSDLRKKRMAKPPQTPQQLTTYLCPVEEELVTPFWAVNGTGVRLAIVNSPPFEQAIHTVKCARGQPGRCHPTRPCWCTQEYSWFRLLAYDATDNCKGIFMDWFKFPSHCACKCVQAAAATAENGASVPVSVAPLLPT